MIPNIIKNRNFICKNKSIRSLCTQYLKVKPKPRVRFYCNDIQRSQTKSELQYKEPSTFVSSYYRIDEFQLLSFIERKKLEYKMGNANQIIIKECPFCHDTKGHISNLYKLYIYKDNGRYYCFRCGAQGSWFDFQRRLGAGFNLIPSQLMPSDGDDSKAYKMPDPSKLPKYIENLKKLPRVLKYLTEERKLKEEVLEAYKVGACVLRVHSGNPNNLKEMTDHLCVTFPWIELNKANKEVFVRTKSRSITDKTMQRLEPSGGRWSLFGLHLISPDTKTIIITEGEFDAMSVYQATGIPAVSLPSGANCLPIDIIEKLEKFEKIIIWMDDDVVGQEGAQKFANKLGRERCLIVQTRGGKSDGPKDANEALVQGYDLNEILKQAKPIPHKQIISFNELRNEVYREMANPHQVAGYQSLSFPTLNKILKGHRKGEMTIITGPTGIGKTTILAQLSLDYLVQGVNTLWGSFEVRNVRLAKTLLTQYAHKNLENNLEEFNIWADKFSQLPLYFMKFHGSTDIDHVLDAMEYAVYVYDVEHIILDNLQFMTPGVISKGFEKFDILDSTVSKLRKFATTNNIHLSLVIHPRKEDDGRPLSTSSVFGSAKATQEADNVIIIQHGKHYRYLEITKNRFAGEIGKIPYRFIKESNRYVELTPKQILDLEKSKNNNNPWN